LGIDRSLDVKAFWLLEGSGSLTNAELGYPVDPVHALTVRGLADQIPMAPPVGDSVRLDRAQMTPVGELNLAPVCNRPEQFPQDLAILTKIGCQGFDSGTRLQPAEFDDGPDTGLGATQTDHARRHR
jgi:hypothetical protein